LSLPEVTSDTVGAVGFRVRGGLVPYLAADSAVSAAAPFSPSSTTAGRSRGVGRPRLAAHRALPAGTADLSHA